MDPQAHLRAPPSNLSPCRTHVTKAVTISIHTESETSRGTERPVTPEDQRTSGCYKHRTHESTENAGPRVGSRIASNISPVPSHPTHSSPDDRTPGHHCTRHTRHPHHLPSLVPACIEIAQSRGAESIACTEPARHGSTAQYLDAHHHMHSLPSIASQALQSIACPDQQHSVTPVESLQTTLAVPHAHPAQAHPQDHTQQLMPYHSVIP